ncbi:MAG: hypothetical protein FD177_1721 [Desulfovibrionaceae bacterium]|nr:MAG: hypothetical protein FD177_1721 [Desulfovibrionaceae bacterium]
MSENNTEGYLRSDCPAQLGKSMKAAAATAVGTNAATKSHRGFMTPSLKPCLRME